MYMGTSLLPVPPACGQCVMHCELSASRTCMRLERKVASRGRASAARGDLQPCRFPEATVAKACGTTRDPARANDSGSLAGRVGGRLESDGRRSGEHQQIERCAT